MNYKEVELDYYYINNEQKSKENKNEPVYILNQFAILKHFYCRTQTETIGAIIEISNMNYSQILENEQYFIDNNIASILLSQLDRKNAKQTAKATLNAITTIASCSKKLAKFMYEKGLCNSIISHFNSFPSLVIRALIAIRNHVEFVFDYDSIFICILQDQTIEFSEVNNFFRSVFEGLWGEASLIFVTQRMFETIESMGYRSRNSHEIIKSLTFCAQIQTDFLNDERLKFAFLSYLNDSGVADEYATSRVIHTLGCIQCEPEDAETIHKFISSDSEEISSAALFVLGNLIADFPAVAHILVVEDLQRAIDLVKDSEGIRKVEVSIFLAAAACSEMAEIPEEVAFILIDALPFGENDIILRGILKLLNESENESFKEDVRAELDELDIVIE